ncbi:AraC family ligand binding domain-containing protein [Draconibacterium mangrovi]|uniref:AraC family ligand binding domain-containing protein n=1 Tax=Draconibacterium mangrovi TaxID=2697469 RepID=UPI0013CF8B17
MGENSLAQILEISDSFTGDRSVVLSHKQLNNIQDNPIISELYITAIGFYPYAKHHCRERIKGINECILLYCIDGMGTISIENEEYELKPNSFFVIPSHIWKNRPN